MVYLFPILLPLITLCSLSNCLIFSEDLHAVFCSHASAAMEFLATTQEAHLDQVVEEPTRTTEYSSSILDLFFTNNRTLINTVKIIPGILDHDAVLIESSLRLIVCKKAPRKVHVYNKADFSSIRTKLQHFREEFEEDARNMTINDLWTRFKTTLTTWTNEHRISKLVKGNGKLIKPWITTHFKDLMKKLSRLFKKSKRTSDQADSREKRGRANGATSTTGLSLQKKTSQ